MNPDIKSVCTFSCTSAMLFCFLLFYRLLLQGFRLRLFITRHIVLNVAYMLANKALLCYCCCFYGVVIKYQECIIIHYD